MFHKGMPSSDFSQVWLALLSHTHAGEDRLDRLGVAKTCQGTPAGRNNESKGWASKGNR